MEKNVCIISFSPIYRDARVLRQIKYLSPRYGLTVIGYGKPHPNWAEVENIHWISLDLPGPLNSANDQHTAFHKDSWNKTKKFFTNLFKETWVMRILRTMLSRFRLFVYYAILGMGRFHRSFYEWWYWRNIYHIRALEYAAKSHCDAFHANDWDALPVAAEAAKMNSAKLVFDAHEYAPLELENRPFWKLLNRPLITYFIKKYAEQISTSITVAPLISQRYKGEFGLDSMVVLNAPEKVEITFKESNFNHIDLVHHGNAIRDRRLEMMIETLAYCDQRFRMHFILLNNDPEYLKELKKLTDALTPGRIIFHNPVPPEDVVARLTEFDVGFCLIAPTNYNYLVSLPNKFFDYIMAGLAVCIGPSPSMEEIVYKYGLGCVASSFDPRDVAETLNQLTGDQLSMMRKASQEATKKINGQSEMRKLVELYHQLDI